MLTQRQRLSFLLPFILAVVPFVLWPALFGLAGSFTNYAPFQTTPLRFVGLTNYLQILRHSDFQVAIRNAILFTAVTVVVELLLGLTVAYALRKPFRGRGIVRFILLMPWLVSPVANGVMWHFLVNPYVGLINFWPALFSLPRLADPFTSGLALPMVMVIEIWRKAPLAGFLILPGLLTIPGVQWDIADLEGMSLVARLRHIVLPRLRLLMLTIALLLIGDALGTAESILVLTGGGPGSATMTPGLYSYEQAFHAFDWSSGSTSAWLIAAAVLLVGVGYLRLARREALP